MYTVPEFAEIVGWTPGWVYEKCRLEEITHVKIGSRRILIPESSIKEVNQTQLIPKKQGGEAGELVQES